MIEKKEKEQENSFFSQLKALSREVFMLDRKPLIDMSFSFPYKEMSEGLQSVFGIEVSLKPSSLSWKSKEEHREGLVSPFVPIALSLPKCTDQVILLISQSDIKVILEKALKISSSELEEQDKSFFERFTHFFVAELVATASSLPSMKGLSFSVVQEVDHPDAGFLCQDIDVAINGHTTIARLVIPSAFLASWHEARKSEPQEKALSENLTASIVVEAGRSFLTQKEILSLNPGDWVLVEHPFYIPHAEKEKVVLTFRGRPIFRGKLKEGQVKVLDMPYEYEVFSPIGGHHMEQEFDEDQEKSEVFHEKDEKNDDPASLKDPEMDPQPDPQEDVEEESQEDLQGDLQGDLQETPQKESKQEKPKQEKSKEELKDLDLEHNPFEGEEKPQAKKETAPLIKEPIKFDEIPLPVVVQFAEVQLSLKELTNLQPGNLLDLELNPEDGVKLVVHGKVFAEGDLMMIQDHVGVRIRDIGFLKKE